MKFHAVNSHEGGSFLILVLLECKSLSMKWSTYICIIGEHKKKMKPADYFILHRRDVEFLINKIFICENEVSYAQLDLCSRYRLEYIILFV